MSFEVRLRPTAQKELDALSKQDYTRIGKIISDLENNPRPTKVKKPSESGLWRIRAGKYRVFYTIDEIARAVIVVRVARRRENTYKGL